MNGPRTFGTKTQSVASRKAGAMSYLVMAREPTADVLVKSYRVKPSDAERMVADEMDRRANGSASTLLRGIIG